MLIGNCAIFVTTAAPLFVQGGPARSFAHDANKNNVREKYIFMRLCVRKIDLPQSARVSRVAACFTAVGSVLAVNLAREQWLRFAAMLVPASIAAKVGGAFLFDANADAGEGCDGLGAES